MNRRLLLVLVLASTLVGAAPLPYDESADAKTAVQQALESATTDQRLVLLIFGANWCEDCRALDQALKTGRNATLLAQQFEVVKVDVGRFNRNLDIARIYANPIQKGIPAAVVLAPDNHILYTTKAGELADARRMSESGIYDFFEGVVQALHRKP